MRYNFINLKSVKQFFNIREVSYDFKFKRDYKDVSIIFYRNRYPVKPVKEYETPIRI